MSMAGGYSVEKPADAEVQAIFETADVASSVGGVLGSTVSSITVISYQTQVVRALSPFSSLFHVVSDTMQRIL